MMITYDVLDGIVSDMNQEIYDKCRQEEVALDFSSSGYQQCVRVCAYGILWDSEDGDKKWIDDDNQEPLIDCLVRRMQAYADTLSDVAKAMKSMDLEHYRKLEAKAEEETD